MPAPSFLAITLGLVAATVDGVSGQGAAALPEYAQGLLTQLSPDADKVISVLGDVRNPRTTIIPAKDLTVSKAIEIAGGFGDFAVRRKVGVWRAKEGRYFTVDVKAVLEKKPGAVDHPLNAGDVVLINQRFDYF